MRGGSQAFDIGGSAKRQRGLIRSILIGFNRKRGRFVVNLPRFCPCEAVIPPRQFFSERNGIPKHGESNVQSDMGDRISAGVQIAADRAPDCLVRRQVTEMHCNLICGLSAQCCSASFFKRFVPKTVLFSNKTYQICHCEEGACARRGNLKRNETASRNEARQSPCNDIQSAAV